MKTTEYLYGDLGEYFEEMQKELAEHKIHCAERTIDEITNVPPAERDVERYAAVKKAIEFNKFLLKEFSDDYR